MRGPAGVLAVAFLAATLSAAIAQGTKHPTTVSFSAEQVNHGQARYMANCAYCHGVDLGGLNGPALAGPDTKVSWQTGAALWGYTTAQMPVGNAGGLSDSDYLSIVAYILARNGQRPGKHAMTVAAIANDTNNVGGAAR